MRSKQALEKLKEKDLEVLKIIKEHIVIDSVGNVLIRSISKENEQKIIKGWLNEKI